MNSVISTPPPLPHQLYNPRLSPSRSMPYSSSSLAPSRKRKAEDDDPKADDRMSTSPSNSPAPTSQPLPSQRQIKRPRSSLVGRPLTLPRLLETLDAESLRAILKTLCDRHPAVTPEVVATAPRPNVASTLNVLKTYEETLRSSYPFGGNSTSDYAYNRVRPALQAILDALTDFTPHFLPPNETQANQSLNFLDGATDIIHRLPEWDSYQNNLHKQNAYDEIAKAWAIVLREAATRGGGFQLQYGGWDQKLAKHNEIAKGKMQEAVEEMGNVLGWMGGQGQVQPFGERPENDLQSVRQELLSGTYGANLPSVRVGPW
ncbi:Tethering factor for nuclear proteasome sts1 [Agyrium rufum]|nr:Tethering factor for nuclear proteasome sts1 [Agyrium rufum]